MKKIRSAALLLLVLAMLLCACGGKTIGRDAALQAALADAGLKLEQVVDVDVDLEKDRYSSWYEVSFENGSIEYEYKINASSGEILSVTKDT